nr:MAG TPA: helix-turn-helix domain protein [Caudoviricetes sp.]
MKNRIKEIRSSLNMSQTEFANKLGTTRSGVQAWEYGLNNPSTAMQALICNKFNINREWLVNGKGEMIVPTNSRTLDEVTRMYSGSRTFRAILDVYAELDDASRAVFDRYVERLIEVLSVGGDTTKVIVNPSQAEADENAKAAAALDNAAAGD